MPKPRKPEAPVVRTTVELPPDLWEQAKLRAIKNRSDLRTIIIAALRAYLNPKKEDRR